MLKQEKKREMNEDDASGRDDEGDDYWISVSDLMAGLMMVFLLLFVVYNAREKYIVASVDEKLLQETERIQGEAQEKVVAAREELQDATLPLNNWSDIERDIEKGLENEFGADTEKWGVQIGDDLTLFFLDNNVLFEQNSAVLQPGFKALLSDIFPRYIELLYSNPKFKEEILEIRIEGHTSSEWENLNKREAFIKNMELSQDRTRSVLGYVLSPEMLNRIAWRISGGGAVHNPELEKWMIQKVSAIGFSSSRLRYADQREDKHASRRVELTIRTKAKEALLEAIRELEEQGFLATPQ